MYFGYGYLDPWYFILILPTALFALYAQSKVNSTFQRYLRVGNRGGYTGAQVARELLRISGIDDVTVEAVRGHLTDHYDPRNKVLRLSESVYNSHSVGALGVAAHETGHAIQHHTGYLFLAARNAIFPLVNISSKMAMPLIILGLILTGMSGFGLGVAKIGIILFAVVVLFQLITLPVEFDASSRAIHILESYDFLTREEIIPAKKVLNAAALTYVASAAVALAQLLRFIMIFGGGRRRND